MRMHDKRCSVKLALVGLATLAFATPAHAELVATASDGLLAVAPAGTPWVAVVRDDALVLETRTASGWQAYPAGAAPGPVVRLAGLVAGRDGTLSLLLEGANGDWLMLVRRDAAGALRRWTIVRPDSQVGRLGPAGLALDARGSPVVSYTAMRGAFNAKLGGIPTYLRLARLAGARLRTAPITRRGFPQSDRPPASVPVLVGGVIHVVETYTSAAIEWQPKRRGGWIGQYLFLSVLGAPVGPIAAVSAAGGEVWSAWTQDYPTLGETHVLLNLRRTDETTDDVVGHGSLVSLTLADGQPELAANDWVDAEGTRDYAGLVTDAEGNAAELDGRLAGYVALPNGDRQLLVAEPEGLQWYDVPARPSVHVTLTAAADGRLAGHVAGALGGASIQLYRERPDTARVLIATVPLAADGSFSARDGAPLSPTLYRAVYSDPASGLPYASLTRTPIG